MVAEEANICLTGDAMCGIFNESFLYIVVKARVAKWGRIGFSKMLV
jgi:hypothetical protein